jgi:hypothetical protein
VAEAKASALAANADNSQGRADRKLCLDVICVWHDTKCAWHSESKDCFY